MTQKKPHKTFTMWAKKHGPIYSIKAGYSKIVVLNSTQVAKEPCNEIFVNLHKEAKALKILTSDKYMVATSVYNDFYKTVKRHILTNVLGPSAQKRLRENRETLIENTISQLNDHVKNNPLEA